VNQVDMTGKPAGMYPDPQDRHLARYWDGLAWTSLTREVSAASAAQASDSSDSLPTAASVQSEPSQDARGASKAQKLVLWAIALNIMFLVARIAIVAEGGPDARAAKVANGLTPLVAFCVAMLAIVGVFWLTTALRYHMAVRVVCVLLMFVPLVSFITLVVLNSRATRLLRAHGYKVGLLGAR
jgi:hypothetical protein